MSNNKIIITRPSHDGTTAYLNKWSEEIISAAKSHGSAVIDLGGARANRREFERCLQAHDPRMVILNGHGSADRVTGHDNEPLLIAGDNEKLTAAKIVYALSCKSAATLGESCVKNGAQAYIGYSQDFIFLFDPNHSVSPLKDEIARPFFESTNIIPISILKGNTASQATEKSRNMFQKNIEYFKTHDSVESPHVIAFLRWDLAFQKTCGDGTATL